jgi:hypothetical protein
MEGACFYLWKAPKICSCIEGAALKSGRRRISFRHLYMEADDVVSFIQLISVPDSHFYFLPLSITSKKTTTSK